VQETAHLCISAAYYPQTAHMHEYRSTLHVSATIYSHFQAAPIQAKRHTALPELCQIANGKIQRQHTMTTQVHSAGNVRSRYALHSLTGEICLQHT
jgi:hypothetical protein